MQAPIPAAFVPSAPSVQSGVTTAYGGGPSAFMPGAGMQAAASAALAAPPPPPEPTGPPPTVNLANVDTSQVPWYFE